MKTLLLIVGLAAIGLAFYPQINENARGACHALEKRIVQSIPRHSTNTAADTAIGRTFLGALIGELSDGGLAAAYVKQRYPNMPPLLGCADRKSTCLNSSHVSESRMPSSA